MKPLFLKARHIGYRNFLVNMHRSCFGDLGLWAFKLKYGLVDLPWWLRPNDSPITDPRRLLTAGEPRYWMGIDVGRWPDVAVSETWAQPTKENPEGGYRLEVNGEVTMACGVFAQDGVPGSPYWHRRSPFVVYTPVIPPWKEETWKCQEN